MCRQELVCICGQLVRIRCKLVCIRDEKARITQAQRFGERVEVGGLSQPRCEVAGLVLPGFAQRHAFELAERLGGRHGSGDPEFVQGDLAGEGPGEVGGAAEVLNLACEVADFDV